MRFLDTNVILRYLTRDDEAKAEACFRLFQRVKSGQETVFLCEAVIAEVTYVLSSPRAPYRLNHEEIRARLLPILGLRGVKMPQKRLCLHALDIWAANKALDFEDALAVGYMRDRDMPEILSYDTDFDGVPGITRIEP